MKKGNKVYRCFLMLVIVVGGFAIGRSVPAKPGFLRMVQPDGTEILIRLEGDEYAHLVFDMGGNLLELNKDGYYVRSDRNIGEACEQLTKIRQSKLKRHHYSGRRGRPGLLSYANFPTFGEHRSLVVLVEFPNRKFSQTDANDFYTRMMNESGFADLGATGCAREYLVNNSRGQFLPQFDVVGPVMLPQNYQYYGENINKVDPVTGLQYLDDAHPAEMILDACQSLYHQGFDFSPYDCNDDGEIDNIYLFYAGYGEADGGNPATVWPHSGNLLDSDYDSSLLKYGELMLNHYACSNELKTGSGIPDGFGTFVHEFSHVMGLPDMYPMNGGTCVSPDNWDVMDTGCYLNEGKTPPNYSAFELYALGWIEPEELRSPGTYSLPPLHEDDGKAYIVYRSDREMRPDEFFIFENRQQTGQDRFLPGHGMLVWHIDFDQDVWDSNGVNSDPEHSYVRIVEADNKQGHYEIVEQPGRPPTLEYNTENEGDPFPGTTGNTQFTATSVPAFVDWSGKSTAIGLINISEQPDGMINFSVVENGSDSVDPRVGVAFGPNVCGRKVSIEYGEAKVFSLTGQYVTTLSQNPISLAPGVYILPGYGLLVIR